MVEPIQTLSLLLIGGYFLFVFLSLTRRRKTIAGPWLFLLRSFFPNWRFYHGAGHQPRLFWRVLGHDGQWSSWTMFMPRAAFHWHHLLHNPRHNLALANQNLIDHLSFDLSTLPDAGDVSDLVTYQMAQRLTRWLIARDGITAVKYQFQLRQVPAMETVPAEHEAVLTSPMLDW